MELLCKYMVISYHALLYEYTITIQLWSTSLFVLEKCYNEVLCKIYRLHGTLGCMINPDIYNAYHIGLSNRDH